MLDRPCGANGAVARESCRLSIPLRIGVVDGVLEHGRYTVVILRRHKDEPIKL